MVWRFFMRGIWLEMSSKISWVFHLQMAAFKHFIMTKTFPLVMAPSKLSGAAAPNCPKPMVMAKTSGVLTVVKMPLMVPFPDCVIQIWLSKVCTEPLAQTEPSGA